MEEARKMLLDIGGKKGYLKLVTLKSINRKKTERKKEGSEMKEKNHVGDYLCMGNITADKQLSRYVQNRNTKA